MQNNLSRFVAGSHVIWNGQLLYVHDRIPQVGRYLVGRRDWLSSTLIEIDCDQLERGIYCGDGKWRWWRALLPPYFRHMIAPYSLPPIASRMGY